VSNATTDHGYGDGDGINLERHSRGFSDRGWFDGYGYIAYNGDAGGDATGRGNESGCSGFPVDEALASARDGYGCGNGYGAGLPTADGWCVNTLTHART